MANVEPEVEADRWAQLVIGAAIEVHKALGPGFLESVYEEALCVELSLRGIPFVRQMPIAIDYKGHPVGCTRLDLMVGGEVVVELKAVDTLGEIHRAQVISYLKVTGKRLGLLINFNVPLLKHGVLRVVRS